MTRLKGAPPRPIIEKLQYISVNTLKISSLNRDKTYKMDNVSLRWPFLSLVRLSCEAVEFRLPPLHRGGEGIKQVFGLKPHRVTFGIRYYFKCDCGRNTQKLYCLHRRLACRHCHRAIPASQAISKRQRIILQASRLETFLASRLYKQTRERLTKKLGEKAMLAQGKMGTRHRALWD
jgi:hypothetical protein